VGLANWQVVEALKSWQDELVAAYLSWKVVLLVSLHRLPLAWEFYHHKSVIVVLAVAVDVVHFFVVVVHLKNNLDEQLV